MMPITEIDYANEVEKNVSRETFLQLQEFKALLIKWNKTHNLTSRATISDSHLDELIADSICLDKLIKKGNKILDIGSGGGFPGLVLAILGHNIDLVERNFKKAVFLNEAKRNLGLSGCRVLNQDVREIKDDCTYDVICSKAMATTKFIIDASIKYANPTTQYMLLKNTSQLHEVDEAKKLYQFNLQVMENNYKTDSVVLIISEVQNARHL